MTISDIKEAIEWFEAEIGAQESGYAYAIANGQENDPDFEAWLNHMHLALDALKKRVPQKPINQVNYEECPVWEICAKGDNCVCPKCESMRECQPCVGCDKPVTPDDDCHGFVEVEA